MLELLPLLVFAGLLIFAACSDVATMTIPNWVSIALAGLFPLFALIAGWHWQAIGLHLLVGFAALLLGFLLFQLNILGGGDAKLIAGVGVWTGLAAFSTFILWTAVAGGVLALTILLARRQLKPADARPAFVNRLLTDKGGVPYGIAIMTGGLMALRALPIASTSLTMP
jgi:prepilin peptidase CpaA